MKVHDCTVNEMVSVETIDAGQRSYVGWCRKLVESIRAHVARICMANFVVARMLWQSQRSAFLARALISFGCVIAPVLGWVGTGWLVLGLTEREISSAMIGAGLYIVCAVIGVITPIAMLSLERLSDNVAFESVFAKFTRKLIAFSQEDRIQPKLAELIKRVRERAVWRSMAMARIQPQFIRTSGMFVISAAMIAVYAPEVLFMLLVFGGPAMYFELRHAQARAAIEEKQGPEWISLWGSLDHLMQAPSLAMLHQFGAAVWFALQYRLGLLKASEAEKAVEISAALRRAIGALCVGVGLACAVSYLIWCVFAGSFDVAVCMMLLGAVTGLSSCFSEIASLVGQFWSQSMSIQELMDLLDHPATEPVSIASVAQELEYPVAPEELVVISKGAVGVSVNAVTYQYRSSGVGRFAVKGLSFEISPGDIVAVVGPNGAGKSTTMALLLRQLTATSGEIRLNGVNINSMGSVEFSQNVIMMPQELRHFNLTIRELLNLGRPWSKAPDDELWAALDKVQTGEFVRNLPLGLDTRLGVDRPTSVEPSGGQRQRLILAAILLSNRGLVVLDEPVSMVDPDAARNFWNTLFAERGARTVIFSTHHLGAVTRANKILFIENGMVVVEGSHDVLMRSSEKYRKLFDSQAGDYQ